MCTKGWILSGRSVGATVIGWGGGRCIVISASFEYYLIRVHANLVQHPSNDISIYIADMITHTKHRTSSKHDLRDII